MASATYRLFAQAMRERKQIVCTYRGHRRELCPIILGHADGEEKALTFQVGGESSSGLPPDGEWRCLFLSKVERAFMRDGPWRAGEGQASRKAALNTSISTSTQRALTTRGDRRHER
jgi:hypothetical protein